MRIVLEHALQVLKCCVHALGASDEDLLLRIVQPLDQLLANEPSGSLRVMATAVGYMSQGWNRLPEKLGTTLCLVAEAILPQLEVPIFIFPSPIDCKSNVDRTNSFCTPLLKSTRI